jgi:hypothetical protein
MDIGEGTSADCNSNRMPDECEPGADQDCNANGVPDFCDLLLGTSQDVNGNEVPDECEPDCNGNAVPDDFESPVAVFFNSSPFAGTLDTSAPVAQDIHFSGPCMLHSFVVYYESTGTSPGIMMVRFFDGGVDGSQTPLYPGGLVAEYDAGWLELTGGSLGIATLELDPTIILPSHLWMEVEIDQDAGVLLRAAPADTGFTEGLVYDRAAGELLSGPLYLSLRLLGVACSSDCNDNGIEDACDVACGPAGGPCDVLGCGQSSDQNGNGLPDECDCWGDLTGDGRVNLGDFATFAVCFGYTAPNPPYCTDSDLVCSDLDNNGIVDLADFATFVAHFSG